jgi:hypothetical protein
LKLILNNIILNNFFLKKKRSQFFGPAHEILILDTRGQIFILVATEDVSMAWAKEFLMMYFLYIYIYIVKDDFVAMPHDHCFAPRCKKLLVCDMLAAVRDGFIYYCDLP